MLCEYSWAEYRLKHLDPFNKQTNVDLQIYPISISDTDTSIRWPPKGVPRLPNQKPGTNLATRK